jgi:CRISPR/Cas system-associated exonuclease Cas4 (RecB family)
VRGGIDRIDRGGGVLAALDYKRGVLKRTAGRHFQLPLYLLVAMRDFGQAGAKVRADWVWLRDAARKPAVPEVADAAELAAGVANDLWQRVDRVLDGDISPDPDPPELCKRCDMRPVCRFHAVDMGGGDGDAG